IWQRRKTLPADQLLTFRATSPIQATKKLPALRFRCSSKIHWVSCTKRDAARNGADTQHSLCGLRPNAAVPARTRPGARFPLDFGTCHRRLGRPDARAEGSLRYELIVISKITTCPMEFQNNSFLRSLCVRCDKRLS